MTNNFCCFFSYLLGIVLPLPWPHQLCLRITDLISLVALLRCPLGVQSFVKLHNSLQNLFFVGYDAFPVSLILFPSFVPIILLRTLRLITRFCFLTFIAIFQSIRPAWDIMAKIPLRHGEFGSKRMWPPGGYAQIPPFWEGLPHAKINKINHDTTGHHSCIYQHKLYHLMNIKYPLQVIHAYAPKIFRS